MKLTAEEFCLIDDIKTKCSSAFHTGSSRWFGMENAGDIDFIIKASGDMGALETILITHNCTYSLTGSSGSMRIIDARGNQTSINLIICKDAEYMCWVTTTEVMDILTKRLKILTEKVWRVNTFEMIMLAIKMCIDAKQLRREWMKR